MTVEIYLWNPQTQTNTLVQTANNVTSQQTISAACGSVVCTPTPYNDSRRFDFGSGVYTAYADYSAALTLWDISATANAGYTHTRIYAQCNGTRTAVGTIDDGESQETFVRTSTSGIITSTVTPPTSWNDGEHIGNHYHATVPFSGSQTLYVYTYNPDNPEGSRESSYTISLTIDSIICRVYFAISTSTLTYDANGGQGAPTSQTYTVGTAFTLSSVVPTRAGHRFLGWGDSASDLTASYQPGQVVTFAVASKTIYALWRIYTGLLIRNGAGTGLLRGDTTPLPLVDA